MKKTCIELAVLLAAFLLLPFTAFAQDDEMSFGAEEVEAADEETETEGAEEDAEETGEAETIDDIGGLEDLEIEEEGEAELNLGEQSAAAKVPGEERHPIWAVQQVYALRAGRVDVQPSFGVSMNDPFVQHQSVSLGAAYYITEVLAAGLSFNWYRFLDKETDTNFSVRQATHQTVPINDYFWGGQINFTYVPMYGKFALLKEWILHWDVWILGGGGFIFTKPRAVIDPEYREFDEYSMKFCFNVGIGARVYLTRFLALFVELRDYIFPEELESRTTYQTPKERANKDNWVDPEYSLTNNVMLQLGVSLFLPFTFDYKLPK